MIDLLKRIFPLRLAPVSEETDAANSMLCEELPFRVHEYASGSEVNGWIVPQKWKPLTAEIRQGGRLVYDGMQHPLGVVGYSTTFEGPVAADGLKEHLFYHPTLPDALVYHCDYYYKPWKKDWGFGVTHKFYDWLKDGEYEVSLHTLYEKGTMKVLDYLLKGETDETIILNAHNCHAAQANDDISGVVVAIEIMKRLARKESRRYTYRIIIAPEHLGTVFFLANLHSQEVKNLKYVIFLEMLGTKNHFSLQESFAGSSELDAAAHHCLKYRDPDYKSGKFRTIVGNDETVWEAPGYEIPCISISRGLYPEYHSSFDDDHIIVEEKLEEAVLLVSGILEVLETNTTMRRHFTGLVALSNPKYDLYMPTVDPSTRSLISDQQIKWNYLMDCIVRYFDQKTTILDIALKHDIEYKLVYEYLQRFEKKGLISLSA